MLLTLLGVLAAVLPVGLGLPDLPDAVPLGLLAAAGTWGLLAWRKKKGWRRLALAAAPIVLGAGVAVWMVGLSSYAPPRSAPEVGDRAPDIAATRVRDGARFELRAERGQGVLLVFFRGAW